MAFFKALTVFIVCISIFKIIISKSATAGNKNNSTNYNAVITGFVMCPYCKKDASVTVFLDELYRVEWFNRNCNETFFINKYCKNLNRETYNATFHFRCEYYKKAEIKNRWAKHMLEYDGIYFYDFGFIDFRKTKKRKNYKRRNRF